MCLVIVSFYSLIAKTILYNIIFIVKVSYVFNPNNLIIPNLDISSKNWIQLPKPFIPLV